MAFLFVKYRHRKYLSVRHDVDLIMMLSASALIAIPLTWVFFTKVVLANVVYHSPVGFVELFSGTVVVAGIALGMVVTQGLKVARRNPAEVLRNE
jgi:putative ABC transport system permease protein